MLCFWWYKFHLKLKSPCFSPWNTTSWQVLGLLSLSLSLLYLLSPYSFRNLIQSFGLMSHEYAVDPSPFIFPSPIFHLNSRIICSTTLNTSTEMSNQLLKLDTFKTELWIFLSKPRLLHLNGKSFLVSQAENLRVILNTFSLTYILVVRKSCWLSFKTYPQIDYPLLTPFSWHWSKLLSRLIYKKK